MASEKIAAVTEENFESAVLESTLPVLVDFWAEWCPPCRMLSPVLDSLAESLEGRLDIVKINSDEEGALAIRFGVMSIPTLILFKNGKQEAKMIGFRSEDDILDEIEKLL